MSDTNNQPAQAQPERRFFDRKSSSPTLVGVGSRFEGDLTCAGDLAVSGTVVGRSQLNGTLTLSDTGHWYGEVHCAQALLAGSFEGQLVVNGKLEIRATARIQGQITAQQIAIAEGAVIAADMTVSSGAPIQRFEEKRKP